MSKRKKKWGCTLIIFYFDGVERMIKEYGRKTMDFGNNNRLKWSKRVRGLAAQEKRKEKKEKTCLFASSTTVVVNCRIETAGSS